MRSRPCACCRPDPRDLQAHLALARVGERPPSSTSTSLLVRTISTTNRASPRRPPPPFPKSSQAAARVSRVPASTRQAYFCSAGKAGVSSRRSTSLSKIVRSGSAAHRDRLCRRSGTGRACTPARGRRAGDLNVTVPGWRSGTVVASAAGSGGFPAKRHSRWRWSRRPGRAEETERRRELGPDWLTLDAAVCLTALERSVGVRASAGVPEWCSTTARVERHS